MRFDTMCNCIDENWKALKARIQASIVGIKLNGTTYYQTDGTGICDLGSIETEPPTASEVLMDDGTSVQDAIDNHTAEIDNLGDGLADSVKNVEIVEVTNGLNIQTTKNGGSIAQAGLISAGANMKMNGKTIDISDALMDTITGASETAESASTKADDAQTDATEALTKANAAITGIGTAVVDTALEMNIDKNDGSTATEPLFTAGTNLTWNGTKLNADFSLHPTSYVSSVASLFKNSTVGNIVEIYINTSYSAIGAYLPTNYAINTGQYGAEMHISEIGTSETVIKYPSVTTSFIGIVTEKGSSYMRMIILKNSINHYNLSVDSNATITVDSGDSTSVTVTNRLSAIDYAPYIGTLSITYKSSTGTASFDKYYEQIINNVSYEGVQTSILCTLYWEAYLINSMSATIYE